MKKVLSLFLFACFTLFAGVSLSACSSKSDYTVSIALDEQSQEYCTFEVYSVDNGEEELLEANESGLYEFSDRTQLKIVLTATQYGVDFDDLTWSQNGVEKKGVSTHTSGYDAIESQATTLEYGAIKTVVKSDTTIIVGGVKESKPVMKVNFIDYDENNVENADYLGEYAENIKTVLSSAYLSFDESKTDKHKVQKVTGELNNEMTSELSLTNRTSFEINLYLTFELQDNYGAIVTNHNLIDASSIDVKISNEKNERKCRVYYMYGAYKIVLVGQTESFDFANENNVTIDFSKLRIQDFTFDKSSNFTYSVTTPETLNYFEDGELTITKKLDLANFDGIKVSINTVELEQKFVSEDKVTYTIPKYMTVASSSNSLQDPVYQAKHGALSGVGTYFVNVSGITYSDGKTMTETKLNIKEEFDASVTTVNASGEAGDYGTSGSGNATFLSGDTQTLSWHYVCNEIDGNYVLNSEYKLDDFTIKIKSGETTDEINLKDWLDLTEFMSKKVDKTVESSDEKWSGKNLSREYTLKFLYGKDITCQLEFTTPDKNTEISFDNFVEYTENVAIGIAFSDTQILKLTDIAGASIAIEGTNDWKTINLLSEKVETVQLEVKAGDVIVFRLTSSTDKLPTSGLYISNKNVAQMIGGYTVDEQSRTVEFRYQITKNQLGMCEMLLKNV